jgi:hypothetical protein
MRLMQVMQRPPSLGKKDRSSGQPALPGSCVGRIARIDVRAGSGRDRDSALEISWRLAVNSPAGRISSYPAAISAIERLSAR